MDKAIDAPVNLTLLLSGRCAYCGGLAQGNHAIHRDGFGEGPEVPLCDNCGAFPEPSCEAIWARISE